MSMSLVGCWPSMRVLIYLAMQKQYTRPSRIQLQPPPFGLPRPIHMLRQGVLQLAMSVYSATHVILYASAWVGLAARKSRTISSRCGDILLMIWIYTNNTRRILTQTNSMLVTHTTAQGVSLDLIVGVSSWVRGSGERKSPAGLRGSWNIMSHLFKSNQSK